MGYTTLEKIKHYVSRVDDPKLSDNQRAWAVIKANELIAEEFERSGGSKERLLAISNRAKAKRLRNKYRFR